MGLGAEESDLDGGDDALDAVQPLPHLAPAHARYLVIPPAHARHAARVDEAHLVRVKG